MTGEILDVGHDVFKYTVGQVLDYTSAARAAVILQINYETGRMYVEPFVPGIPTLWRRVWLRLRYGYRWARS